MKFENKSKNNKINNLDMCCENLKQTRDEGNNEINKECHTKGITLIALVVTIVVLLILAGVSINLVLSNNGVISKAKDAKEKHLQAQENDTSYLNDAADWIEREVTSQGGTNTPTTKNASTITVDDYGKVVTNYQTGTSNVWEILYADNDNVYLITRNYPECGTVNDEITGYNGTSDFDGGEAFKAKFPAVQAGWLNKIYTPSASGVGTLSYTSSNINMKATEYLLDSSIWNTNYKTDKADWAVGGPTLELFVAAYNKKFTDKAVTIETPTGYGYKYDDALYNENSLPPSDSVTTGTKKSNIFNHGYHYWIACPSNYRDDCVRLVSYSAALVGSGTYPYCMRPVVYLSSGVTLTQSEDGNTFTIN